MHILDKEAVQHEVHINDNILLDTHLVASVTWQGHSVLLDKYHIPKELQGKGIGTALLREIEQILRRRGANRIVVHIEDALCPIYGGFFTKNGYVQEGTRWSKTLTLSH